LRNIYRENEKVDDLQKSQKLSYFKVISFILGSSGSKGNKCERYFAETENQNQYKTKD